MRDEQIRPLNGDVVVGVCARLLRDRAAGNVEGGEAMKRFAITFKRAITQRCVVVVEAENDLEATDKAEAKADNDEVDWNRAASETGDHQIEDITPL